MSQSRTLARAPAQPISLRWLTDDGRWLALAAPALIFLGHVLYGAMLSRTALSLAACAAILLGAVLLLAGRVRRELAGVRGLAIPALLFAALLAAALWSMTPAAPGGPHPVWSYLGVAPGATTMDKSLTLLEMIKLMGLACVFALGLALGASEARARLSFNVIVALGAALAFYSFFSFATGASGLKRLGSTFYSWNTAATLFAMLLMLSAAGALARIRSAGRKRALVEAAPFIAAALFCLGCLVASASRGGFTSAAAGLAVFAGLQLFAGRGKFSKPLLLGLGALVAFAIVLAISAEQLVDRFIDMSWEADGRQVIFEAHWKAFREAPLMGYGLGTFDTINRTLLDAGNLKELWSVRAAHNVFLTWLEHAGIIGAAPMFACIAVLLGLTVRNALKRSRFTVQLFALIAASVVVLVHGLTDFALETYSMAAFWALLLGLGFSAAQGWSHR